MSEPIAGMSTEELFGEIPILVSDWRWVYMQRELLHRAKRGETYARQLRRLQQIFADESVGLLECYQQMGEIIKEIPNPYVESMKPVAASGVSDVEGGGR